jgi:hypothetical protein
MIRPSRRGLPAALALLALLALPGCPASRAGGAAAAPSGAEPAEGGEAQAPTAGALIGSYHCRFLRGETELEPAACAIRPAQDGSLRFEQPGGPIRLGGTVVAEEAGFRLTGEVHCSIEPCPSAGTRDLLFFTQGPGAFSAVAPLVGGELLNIDLTRAE